MGWPRNLTSRDMTAAELAKVNSFLRAQIEARSLPLYPDQVFDAVFDEPMENPSCLTPSQISTETGLVELSLDDSFTLPSPLNTYEFAILLSSDIDDIDIFSNPLYPDLFVKRVY
jgi:hypothetical protein